MTWGYKCCHSITKQSYCTGQAGIEAFSADATAPTGTRALASGTNGDASGNSKSFVELVEENIKRKAAETAAMAGKGKKRAMAEEIERDERDHERASRKRLGGRDETGDLNPEKLEKAIQAEKRRKQLEGDDTIGYNAQDGDDLELTEEQLEVSFCFLPSPPRSLLFSKTNEMLINICFLCLEISIILSQAYRMNRDLGHEDPMNNIKGDELLPL